MSIERQYPIKHTAIPDSPPSQSIEDNPPSVQDLPKVAMIRSSQSKDSTKEGYEALSNLAFREKLDNLSNKGFLSILATVISKLNT